MALAAVMAISSGCAGIFQRSMPDRAATFERSGRGEVLVGIATADITPDGEPLLGGFDLNRAATRVESKLEVSAFVLVVGDLRIAIVGVDNLGLQLGDADWIKSGISGFANGCVFLCSSHTHAGPDLIGLWGRYMLTSGRSREYLTKVRSAVVRAVAAALDGARPARLSVGEARAASDGPIRNSNRSGVFDRRVTVLHAEHSESGEPIGSLLHLACHPEVLRRRNTAISADFVGALRDGWRAAGHGPAVFVNGALGAMISPKPKGVDELGPTGAVFCQIAERALATARAIEVDECVVRRREVFLPMRSWALRLARLTTVIPREVYAGCLRSTVGYLRIGDGFEACCLPGEAEPGYARRIVASSGRRRMLVFGLVDDELGYFMSERDARDPEFEYERTMSPGPRAGELLIEALVGDG